MPAGHRAAQMPQDGIGVVFVRGRHAEGSFERGVAVDFPDVVAGCGVWRREDEGSEVEAGKWKFDGSVDLARTGAGLGACGETFKVDDEKLWGAGDGDTLRSLSLLAAVRTTPDFVA